MRHLPKDFDAVEEMINSLDGSMVRPVVEPISRNLSVGFKSVF